MSRLLRAAGALVLAAALGLALLRYGATEERVLYLFGCWMLVPALLACLRLSPRAVGAVPLALLGLAGGLLLAQVALRPTLEARGFLLAAVGWAALVSALWIARDRRLRVALLLLVVAAGAAEALYGFGQALGGSDRIFGYTRHLGAIATGTFISRNNLAGLLNMTLGLVFGFLFTVYRRGRRRRAATSELLAQSWIVLIVFSFVGLALLLSRSRGGVASLLATAGFIAVLLALYRRRREAGALPPWVAGGFLAIVLALGLMVGIGGLGERLAAGIDRLRPQIWLDSLRVIAHHPLTGVGPGMFEWGFAEHQTADTHLRIRHAHNDYLEIAVEWGLPLAVLFWSFIFWRLRRSIHVFLTAREAGRQGLALGCSAALFALVVHALVDFNLHIPANLVIFMMILGVAWTVDPPRAAAAPGPATSMRGFWLAGRLVLVGLILFAGWRTWGRYQALELAARADTVADYERALARDPQSSKLHAATGVLYRELPGIADPERARVHLERAVELNPRNWRWHRELARWHEAQGDLDAALAALSRAAELRPREATLQWQIAHLHLRRGATDEIWEPLRRALANDPELMQAAAYLLVKLAAPGERFEQLWPPDPASRLGLLRVLGGATRLPGAPAYVELRLAVWRELLEHEPPELDRGEFVVRDLLEIGAAAAAREAWMALASAHGLVDGEFRRGENALWNGSFDLPLTGAGLDWRVAAGRRGYTIERRQSGGGRDGVVRVEFKGSENVEMSDLEQQITVRPATRYSFAFDARRDGLTTDEGPFFELYDPVSRRVLLATEPLVGSAPWERRSSELDVPAGSERVVLRLRRRASRRFDNKIRGSLELDRLTLAPLPEADSR